jgi:hypothetical protein
MIQSVLFLTHPFLYETWTFSPVGNDTPGAFWIKLVLGFLSVSFVAASLLAFRYTNALLRAFYRAAAVWVGLLTFLFVGAVTSWIIFGVARLAGVDVNFHRTVELLFGAAAVAGLYGVLNAGWTRITRTTVRTRELAGGLARAKSGADQRCAPWAVHTLELDGAADLPAVCVWLKPHREDAGFHFERSGNVGTAAASGIESRNCDARVRVKLLAVAGVGRRLQVKVMLLEAPGMVGRGVLRECCSIPRSKVSSPSCAIYHMANWRAGCSGALLAERLFISFRVSVERKKIPSFSGNISS